jgi:non-specific serine/threonine protein kinase
VEHAIAHSRSNAADPAIAWADGSKWSEDEAIAFARGLRPASPRTVPPLTAREFRVAELVADGFTNGQLAARLDVSPRTIANHIQNIRGKLGLPTRAHLIAWVVTRRSAGPR